MFDSFVFMSIYGHIFSFLSAGPFCIAMDQVYLLDACLVNGGYEVSVCLFSYVLFDAD